MLTKLSLVNLHAFYIYGQDGIAERGDGPHSPPIVRFEKFSIRCSAWFYRDGACQYLGIQVSLVPYEDFWHIINPMHFCCSDDDAVDLGCTAQNLLLQNVSSQPGFHFKPIPTRPHHSEIYVYTVMGQEPIDHQFRISSTGVYLLMVSNCGYEHPVTLSGSVIVRNSYGFLPGIWYPKKAFSGWLAVAYAMLTCAWALLMATWRQELFKIHACFIAVSIAGTARAVSWWVFLHDFNNVGIPSKHLWYGVMLVEGMDEALQNFLLLSASCGW
eukprot:CAMPEP_0117578418 /NCGR_PEP_ID=MMETSP0784-20121206/63997_1 /TAXON_ID=39447 /ORGANISM="" /LENGTH=270 /DNA_ID=CAMNT_0005378089 /DNA_START=112 /DNA_END=921 /DNA_ORIENTATION=+